MNLFFSKSNYVEACKCVKASWLSRYKPEEKQEPTDFTKSLFENGHLLGELAKKKYQCNVDVTVRKENDKLDYNRMIDETKKHIQLGTRVIAEASFNYNGLFCSVDILINNGDGTYNLYEVKSSQQKTSKKNPLGVDEKYIIDISYQRYVLEHCGIKLKNIYAVLLREGYIFDDFLNLDEYFIECDISSETQLLQKEVEENINVFIPVLSVDKEPNIELSKKCNGCDYWEYCSRNISKPSVFDIYNLDFDVKCDLFKRNITFFDAFNECDKLSDTAKIQILYYNNDLPHVNKKEVKSFLDDLVFPLYSLDFETFQMVVPEYKGVKTYEQIPFQYSLHIMKKPNYSLNKDDGDIVEKHFLDLSGGDMRRKLAESLVKNIPYGSCVIAYNKSVESNIVKRLASTFTDLSDHLLSFIYKDPLPLFKNGYYYVKEMGSSFSIKSVAPALYPDDMSMNYHNLEGNVKNGMDAMNVFYKLKDMTLEEKKQIETDLINYCALDTYSLVKILKKLYEAVN